MTSYFAIHVLVLNQNQPHQLLPMLPDQMKNAPETGNVREQLMDVVRVESLLRTFELQEVVLFESIDFNLFNEFEANLFDLGFENFFAGANMRHDPIA